MINQVRIQGGRAFGACAPPPLSLMPNEKISRRLKKNLLYNTRREILKSAASQLDNIFC